MKRLIKGLKHIDEVAEGVYNFKFPKDCIENKAMERAEICRGCEHNTEDPIADFHVMDRIEHLSKKMCSLCGCVLSYKLRINKIKTENCPHNDEI